jgi:transcriptional regulator with XRE-family HTH domain
MTVNQAVRALRKHLKKTQQTFATELKISISSLNNYERERMPEPRQLLMFQRASHEAGRDDLAGVFGKAARASLGVAWDSYSGSGLELRKLDPDNPDHWYEIEALDALAECLGGATLFEDITPTVVSALRLVLERRAAINLDTDRVKRFEEESIRRGYVPKVRGRALWETTIRRRRKFKGLTKNWEDTNE